MAGPWQPMAMTEVRPNSAAVERRALRAEAAAVEKQTEQADEAFARAGRKLDVDERNATVNEDNLEARLNELSAKEDLQKYEQQADWIIGMTKGAESAEDKLAYANERFPEFLEMLPDGKGKKAWAEMYKDGLQGPELEQLYSFGLSVKDKITAPGGAAGYAAKDTYVGQDGKEYHGWYDDSGKFNKTGVRAKTESGAPTNYDPPNAAELETAEKLIASDEKLDDLPRAEKAIAKMILASDIRQLQEDFGKSYEEAAAMALAGLKKKVTLEKDFLTGTDSKLNIGGSELGEGEYLGSDGSIYVETEDGGFRRKD